MATSTPVNVCVAAAEVAPWSKTGGLGDVCGALPIALARRGHRVMTIAPRYRDYADAWDTGVSVDLHLFGQMHRVGFFHLEKDGVHRVFVDHPSYRRAGIYGDAHGAYGDNLFRFALLSRAAIEAAARLPLGDGPPLGEDVVFHANDWHTALVPLYLEAVYRPVGRFPGAGTVLGVHNAGHHGSFDAHAFAGLDVASRWWPAVDFGGRVNCLKTGVALSRKLVAVSPTYARELTTHLGFGLEGLFAARGGDLHGVLNGVDTDAWNPATDPHLPAHYDAADLSGKAVCKAALQRELGLPVRADVPLFAVIARLDAQKGIDLLLEVAPWLLRQDVQLVVLGSGGHGLQDALRGLENAHRDKVRAWIGFNEPLAHRIEAGADVFLMPSRFEPCGLNQMYSMRYGTVPIVHSTGGLADTVETVGPGRGTGWAFWPFSAEAFLQALGWALVTYHQYPVAWREIVRRGMARDFSWERAAVAYESVYAAARRG